MLRRHLILDLGIGMGMSSLNGERGVKWGWAAAWSLVGAQLTCLQVPVSPWPTGTGESDLDHDQYSQGMGKLTELIGTASTCPAPTSATPTTTSWRSSALPTSSSAGRGNNLETEAWEEGDKKMRAL